MESECSRLVAVPLLKLDSPFTANYRAELESDDVADLVASMRAVGQLQPVHVRVSGDRYELVAGFRRVAAARELGWTCILAIVGDFEPERVKVVQLEENLARRDPTAVEEAQGVAQLLDLCGGDIHAAAGRLNRSLSWVQTRIDLAALPPDLLTALQARVIGVGAALALGRVQRDDVRATLLKAVVENGATVRQVEAWVSDTSVQATGHDAAAVAFAHVVDNVGRVRLMIRCKFCDVEHPVGETSHVPLCNDCARSFAGVPAPVAGA